MVFVKIKDLAAHLGIGVAEGIEGMAGLRRVEQHIASLCNHHPAGIDGAPEKFAIFLGLWIFQVKIFHEHDFAYISWINGNPAVARKKELSPAMLPGGCVFLSLFTEPNTEYFPSRHTSGTAQDNVDLGNVCAFSAWLLQQQADIPFAAAKGVGIAVHDVDRPVINNPSFLQHGFFLVI
ncbi:hypothetical protein [Desulfocastanea catecholica]